MAEEQEKCSYPEEETAAYGPIRYGDVFPVAGDLADKVIVPKDAAMMRTAEKESLGDTIKGGAADVMQSAAKVNVQTGMVEPGESNLGAGVRVVKSDIDDSRIVSEVIGNQVLSKCLGSQPGEAAEGENHTIENTERITIGDALEAAALSAGNKVVTQSDATAIHVAEQLASGNKGRAPGGIADRAQSAANFNALEVWDEDKTTLSDIILEAKKLLAEDKPATRKDAEVVVGAEMRTNARIYVTPGAVGESLAAAAVFNNDTDQHGHQSPGSDGV